MSTSSIPSERASCAEACEVGTAVTRRPRRTRAASAEMNAEAARPDPSPTQVPSRTCSAACCAAAWIPGLAGDPAGTVLPED
jgi:hypothetical protein